VSPNHSYSPAAHTTYHHSRDPRARQRRSRTTERVPVYLGTSRPLGVSSASGWDLCHASQCPHPLGTHPLGISIYSVPRSKSCCPSPCTIARPARLACFDRQSRQLLCSLRPQKIQLSDFTNKAVSKQTEESPFYKNRNSDAKGWKNFLSS
jgi:hypothetical protein